jgi:hypothetical protein
MYMIAIGLALAALLLCAACGIKAPPRPPDLSLDSRLSTLDFP